MEQNEKVEFFNQSQQDVPVPKPQISTLAPQPMTQQSEQIKYAGFWIRYAAGLIDGLVLIIPNLIVGLIIKFATFGVAQQVSTSVSGILVSWIYFVLMTNKYQATLGKKAFGLMVVSDTAENLTLSQIIFRETIGKLISMMILFIGYIMAGFTQKKQALHDKMANTAVIYRDPNEKLSGGKIALIIIISIIPIFAIIVTLVSSVFLVSLGRAREKAQDAAIKATLASIMPDAVAYKNKNSSYKGYEVPSNISIIACSGQPITNISADGKQMAVFMKSCQDANKYFCGNPETHLVTDTAEVDTDYVKSGATVCNSSDVSEISTSNKSVPAKNNSEINNSEILLNNFKDDSLGYEIKYPENWVQQKEADKENGIITITFLPNETDPSAVVYIQSVLGQQTITPEAISDFLKFTKEQMIGANGKVYDEKDFIYDYPDGTKSIGKAFKAEYLDNGTNVKQWLIAIPNGKKLHCLSYVSDISRYDINYNLALAMIKSWKIAK